MTGFCRDCLTDVDGAAGRCPACGSPRLLRHAELDDLSIAHIDCDAFYATVEKRDDPGLADKPVIVGGGRRGVVSTCCYIARMSGVRSAMPMFKALALCPQAVVIRPNMAKYVEVSRLVQARMRAMTPLVEPLSLDEAFLDLGGTARLHQASPARMLARLARDVEREIGITVSIGLAPNKFLAKLGSEIDKPRGFTVIGRAEVRTFLAERPVSEIWGVGKVLREKLAADGITRIGQLQDRNPLQLMARYGAIGDRLARFSIGEDDRRVQPEREAKNVSSETTFDEDIAEFDRLKAILWRQAENVARRLKKADLSGTTVTLKLKSADFRIRSRAATLPDPTQLAETIYRTALPLLKVECDGTRYRLLGVGVSNLAPADLADPPNLLDPEMGRRAAAERAIDAVRAKFGDAAILKGRGFSSGARAKPPAGSSSPSSRNRRNPGPDRR
ncbi:MAG: DNA polymerase IV [Ferrovibrionaceae bacterium]